MVITVNDYISAGADTAMDEFVFNQILPACFVAPLKADFDFNDAQSFLVSVNIEQRELSRLHKLSDLPNIFHQALGEVSGVLKVTLNNRVSL